ncbi:unnamed protein product [Blepharisma stoltei]|uniref:Uncharacterized protein n=1 Tax=Blepharisma stoltei TaxID=1481888 RepID=A0AAU9JEV5_9CILI|nr:unnamed protein product [Blepharisma stoltei]
MIFMKNKLENNFLSIEKKLGEHEIAITLNNFQMRNSQNPFSNKIIHENKGEFDYLLQGIEDKIETQQLSINSQLQNIREEISSVFASLDEWKRAQTLFKQSVEFRLLICQELWDKRATILNGPNDQQRSKISEARDHYMKITEETNAILIHCLIKLTKTILTLIINLPLFISLKTLIKKLICLFMTLKEKHKMWKFWRLQSH